jgi:hypothetical protein
MVLTSPFFADFPQEGFAIAGDRPPEVELCYPAAGCAEKYVLHLTCVMLIITSLQTTFAPLDFHSSYHVRQTNTTR